MRFLFVIAVLFTQASAVIASTYNTKYFAEQIELEFEVIDGPLFGLKPLMSAVVGVHAGSRQTGCLFVHEFTKPHSIFSCDSSRVSTWGRTIQDRGWIQSFNLKIGNIVLNKSDFSTIRIGYSGGIVYNIDAAATDPIALNLRFNTDSTRPDQAHLKIPALTIFGEFGDSTAIVTGPYDSGDLYSFPAEIPLPAGLPLLAAGLIGLGLTQRSKKHRS